MDETERAGVLCTFFSFGVCKKGQLSDDEYIWQ